ncbi:DUF2848 domain-containing protein [Shumkonia mesophila]|uniref:DUF2848 domain-containing protein n=1 Tax=Shumkonia mesophila TaxID=2838854 RepID=UPI0029352B49|nr:DUF2848 domain-containing protein [Shumkonia mesophila]
MLQFRSPGENPIAIDIRELVIAGWAGRDTAAVQAHIRELADVGVAPPSTVPLFYRVSAGRLTTAGRIQVLGPDSSGEAEAVLIGGAGRLWVGIGSDHTDRKVEAYSVAVSKEMCPKPVGPEVWPLDVVADHWDRLILRAHAVIDGDSVLYQEGPVSGLLRPELLMAKWNGTARPLGDGQAMFCGTLAAIGGVRPATRFEMTLEDPVLNRTIRHGYDIDVLPIVA